ncbi:MAG TPA: helix-turn-helix domain-containing protein [Acidobacteriaceae bacterium]
MDKLYSIKDAANRLGGVSKWTIQSWLSSGRLKRTKVGRRTMIAELDLQLFVESCGPGSTAPRIPRAPVVGE